MTMSRRELIKKISLAAGGILSASTVSAILSGCENKTLSAGKAQAISKLLPKEQSATISRLVDIILPRTDTPGALDENIPAFIGSIVSDVFASKEQDAFFNGLLSLDSMSISQHGKHFVELTTADQEALAVRVNLAMTTKEPIEFKGVSEKAFQNALNTFGVIKELTLLGFFSSKVGATEVLHYDPIPGDFHGNVALADIGKTWATPR